jgi:hypothetical protein
MRYDVGAICAFRHEKQGFISYRICKANISQLANADYIARAKRVYRRENLKALEVDSPSALFCDEFKSG